MTCYLLQLPLSRGFLLLTFLLGVPLLLLERFTLRKIVHGMRRRGRLLHRVIAVGGPSGIAEVYDSLRRAQYVGYQVVGACVPEGLAVEPERFPVPVLGRVADTRRLCNEYGADTVLVARGGYGTSHELRRIAWDLEGSSIELVVVPSLTDVAGPRIHMRPVAGLPLLHLEEPQAGEAGGLSKRLFDVVLAGLALLAALAGAAGGRGAGQAPRRRAGAVPAAPDRPRGRDVPDAEVPLDGRRRRGPPRGRCATRTSSTACCSR